MIDKISIECAARCVPNAATARSKHTHTQTQTQFSQCEFHTKYSYNKTWWIWERTLFSNNQSRDTAIRLIIILKKPTHSPAVYGWVSWIILRLRLFFNRKICVRPMQLNRSFGSDDKFISQHAVNIDSLFFICSTNCIHIIMECVIGFCDCRCRDNKHGQGMAWPQQ